jgi:hypothetical protein
VFNTQGDQARPEEVGIGIAPGIHAQLALSKTDVGTILLTHSTFYNFAHFALYNQ